MTEPHIKLWQIMYETDEDGEDLLDIYDEEFEEDLELDENEQYEDFSEEDGDF